MTDRAASWARELEQACGPVHYLCITDVTDGHAIEGAKDGRAIRADGRDLKVLIVSEIFQDKSARERQEVVNGVLYDYIKSGELHSVQMKCWAPAEWVSNGSPVDLGAPCSYSAATGHQDILELGQSLALPACTAPPPPPQQQEEEERVDRSRPDPAAESATIKLCDCGATPMQPAPTTTGPEAEAAQVPPLPSLAPLPPPARPPGGERGRRRVPPEAAATGGTTPVLVDHLRAQGLRGLETAQAILRCDDASEGSRQAASQFLAEQVRDCGDW